MRPADSKAGRTKGGLATFREHGGEFIIVARERPPLELEFQHLVSAASNAPWIGSRAPSKGAPPKNS